MKAIILAGGSGTRLWPYSRREMPKQFLHFGEKRSLLQKTIERFIPIIDPKDILIITSQNYFHLVKTQVMEISLQLENQILIEPEQKNTAPAIALAICYLTSFLKISPQECVLICSSDHLISPQEIFFHALVEAEKIAQKEKNVIFGVRPNKPETGYGYIKLGMQEQENIYHVDKFVEKPDLALAQKYLLSGQYLWNSGIFLFQIKYFIEELQKYCPEIGMRISEDFKEFTTSFSELPNLSIDYALMEKSTNTKVVRLDLNWSDVGSWDSVYDFLEKDQHNNAKMGNVLDIDTKNCLIMGNKRLISTIGLEDVIVVETADALLIGKKGESQRVKALVEELQKQEAKESYLHPTSHRPWGHFTVLEEAERYKLKRIVVEPKQRLSLQMHYHRSEHWIVIKGTAKVTIDQQETILSENESIFVPKRAIHRLENPGKVLLELIEVQVGEYVGEDDIVRLEDVYQRA
ncbi:mannose-1-phosphate guanylyltransferase/mannose-6-phosphate isomerase [Candidatus Rhabdochlamydia porcellionis]|jgi:mannose-1-phosphate guanylyltransferase / mannose-6-phosphate isomerase|uniref:mannose-1-phosphate guanylyltransferase n=1 Tax=Candidatus Rhabdochlamydia porcellionis TaxID=225148 RepID=A0ABX8Z159_9BACT|nr:mannose-1-phosphate guanylyltransferase/mannose-6-phosphate isomerase [Candidatus Rhabdochlamydia porcellionis]QZA59419.1 Alginate biosynthesis protein AlgA [Candidatus Rhabdochlamydia porcellionis]